MNRENWKYLSIGDCASVVGGGTPSTKNPEYWDGDISWISPKDLSNNTKKYVSRGERFITKKGLENSSAKILPENSLLFSSRAPIGYLAINTQPMATNQGFKSLILKDEFDVEFFYYLFKQKTEYIKNFSSGSTFQEISGSEIKNLKFLIPPYKEQKQISKILSKLDKKIELNQKMNETLEDIGKTLFKSWFIDFDPVRAKSEGRPTGLSKEISDLFPDSFDDSELGEIPIGWSYKSIYEDLNVIYGAPFSSKMFNSKSKGIPIIRIRDLNKQKSDIYTEEVHPKGVLIEKGDVVVGMDGEFRPYLWSGENAWMNQRICKFVPKDNLSSTFIIENLRKQLKFIEVTEVATTVIHLGKSDIDEFLIINEDKGLIEMFNKICKPIEEKIISNNYESRKLQEIRDTLLPKLISGKLMISEIESLIEETSI